MQLHDPAKNIRVMTSIGLEVATSADIDAVHALVVRLVGPPTAEAAIMRLVHEHTRASVFVSREQGEISGVVGELPLTPAGLTALWAGDFNGVAPATEHLCAPGQPVAAMYCWGCAADSRRAAALAVKAVVIARNEIYPTLPFFTRAAPPAGADADTGSLGGHAAFRRFGCTPVPGQPGLIYSSSASIAGRSAA